MQYNLGPIILDVAGLALEPEERELLQHPHVAGVILFARNYHSPEQLIQLCSEIRASRKTPLLIAADQEGGRVQRFKEGFVRLPSMGEIGEIHGESPERAQKFAQTYGWLMAAELLAAGVDLSFAPVLDLNKGLNAVVGDRSFSANSTEVVLLAKAVMQGMRTAGMAVTGKHFPGHGSVEVDSHKNLPVDEREFSVIAKEDMEPFAQMIQAGIDAIMPAHILFPKVDNRPVGFSPVWLQEILRKQLHFSGVVFSDDLNMGAANAGGGYAERAEAALEAGCNIALICNNRAAAIEILDQLPRKYILSMEKFSLLQGKFSLSWQALHASQPWQERLNFFLQHRKLHENNR